MNNLDVAQLVYLVRNNQAIREVGSIITYGVVLVLSSFTLPERPALAGNWISLPPEVFTSGR